MQSDLDFFVPYRDDCSRKAVSYWSGRLQLPNVLLTDRFAIEIITVYLFEDTPYIFTQDTNPVQVYQPKNLTTTPNSNLKENLIAHQ